MYVCTAKFVRRLPVPCLYANHVTLPGNVIKHLDDELQRVPMLKINTSNTYFITAKSKRIPNSFAILSLSRQLKRIFYTCENKKNTELIYHITIFSTIEEIIMQPLQENANFSILKGKK